MALKTATALAGLATSATGVLGDLFGSAGKTKGTTTTEGEERSRLEISDEAVAKIMEDLLSEAGGLKDIFSGEQTAGIFDSSVAAQAAGDFAAQVVGEIAKLRAEQVTTATGTTKSVSKTKDGGILGAIKGIF